VLQLHGFEDELRALLPPGVVDDLVERGRRLTVQELADVMLEGIDDTLGSEPT